MRTATKVRVLASTAALTATVPIALAGASPALADARGACEGVRAYRCALIITDGARSYGSGSVENRTSSNVTICGHAVVYRMPPGGGQVRIAVSPRVCSNAGRVAFWTPNFTCTPGQLYRTVTYWSWSNESGNVPTPNARC